MVVIEIVKIVNHIVVTKAINSIVAKEMSESPVTMEAFNNAISHNSIEPSSA